ncbi:MAG: carboxypeptidase regulatory-like domain-containing protein [Dehalococcoidales bacterium]|jgi:hypothetical protein
MTIEELRKQLLRRLDKEKEWFTRRSLHYLVRPLEAKTQLVIGPNKYTVGKESFLVFIDEEPGAYWTHPVRYELYETGSGKVTTIIEKFPLEAPEAAKELEALHIPDLPHLKPKEKDDFLAGEAAPRQDGPTSISYDLTSTCAPHRHALLIAGMNNMVDFYNDFANMYQILVERYGYDPANIAVAMGDGTSYADLPVDYDGTAAGINAALDAYAAGGAHPLGADDSLFLYTFNHGDNDGTNSSLCLWPSWGSYYDYQMAAKLNNIHCGDLIVAMNQCHSGGFIDDVLGSTGPTHISIMTTCKDTESGWPASTGSHGYFSVVLCTALNWDFPDATFPAPIPATLPGYSAGIIDAQDTDLNDGVCAQEAFNYVKTMMETYHYATIGGYETPQWGESAAGIGGSMYWGLPHIDVEDGTPSWWESPDVFLNDPAVTPSDATSWPASPFYWADYYHPDTINRMVARVHNTGCAPMRNVSVEFRVTSSGVGGGTSLIGTGYIDDFINPGQHGYAYVDWDFPSPLIHHCIMVRASCILDPAMFWGAPITSDDNQAQRNVDPAYGAPGNTNPVKTIIRTMEVRNDFEKEAVLTIAVGKVEPGTKHITPEIEKAEALRGLKMKPGQTQVITVRFNLNAEAEVGDKIRFPVIVRRDKPAPAVLGGVTFTVEIARGRLEGHIFSRARLPVKEGSVTIDNMKQPGFTYATKVNTRGRFSFKDIAPGPYQIQAECQHGRAKGSVYVNANTITEKALFLQPYLKRVGGTIQDTRGKVMANQLVTVTDVKTKTVYLTHTDAKGVYRLPGVEPGTFEVGEANKQQTAAKKVKLGYLPED